MVVSLSNCHDDIIIHPIMQSKFVKNYNNSLPLKLSKNISAITSLNSPKEIHKIPFVKEFCLHWSHAKENEKKKNAYDVFVSKHQLI